MSTLTIHCSLNKKNSLKKVPHKKAHKVEYVNNGGYWAKWFMSYDVKSAKEELLLEYPFAKYLRTKLN